jgi:enterochelin esterase family protein
MSERGRRDHDRAGPPAASAPPQPLLDARAELRRALPGMPERDVDRFVASIGVAEPYVPGPEAQPRPDVPQGALTCHRLDDSRVYPGTGRDYQVYVAAACRRDEPAALMVFQDGAQYLGPQALATTVLDNLVAEGSVPPLVAVFVEPGTPGPGLPIYGGEGNRSVEYDATDAAYARFLVEELLPAVAQVQSITDDPGRRALCGLSSGGQCAFAAAWHRPDAFRKVVSHCGSFVAIRGGDGWPAAVRRDEARPLRVFLQTGARDLDIVFGDWVLANRALASALAYRGYDHRFVVGDGGHSLAHGGAMLPETLRWLWRN